MTPAIGALTIGGILLVAGAQGRNVIDVALGRDGKMAASDPQGAAASFLAGTSATDTTGSTGIGAGSVSTPIRSAALADIAAQIDRIGALGLPYKWGGGHAGYPDDGPFDCSGFVSYLLHHAGLMKGPPRTSGMLMLWGQPGRGPHLTVWSNITHVFIELEGRMAGTSRHNLNGGPNWHPVRSTDGFTPRHYPGL